ncbi:uncharacterized protein LOC129219458 isoform X2 [Uloborus diversus]|uniref:uncharacterized protein LOC129219458 isoform X2 n=1 Tax=Uloborus diversus TaxID=327109 RepID=UPI00240A8A7C|nr:uncharacterized protein LOC129219458 isoform X2 [Uloborus diversus]
MLEAASIQFYGGDNTNTLAQLQQHIANNSREYRHHPGLPTTKIMLAPEPPGLPPLEAIYMDEQLRFYEQENGKISYGDLQPIVFESNDHMPPSTPQDLLPSQRPFSFDDIGDLESDKPWQFKPPDQWQSAEVIDWIFHWAAQNRVDLLDVNMLIFNTLTGRDLCRMTRHEFCSIDNQYGSALYDTLQYLIAQYSGQSAIQDQHLLPSDHDLVEDVEWDKCSRWHNVFAVDTQGPSPASGYSGCDSDRESASSSISTVNERSDLGLLLNHSSAKTFIKPQGTGICIKKVGRRGRPPKKDGKLGRKQAITTKVRFFFQSLDVVLYTSLAQMQLVGDL